MLQQFFKWLGAEEEIPDQHQFRHHFSHAWTDNGCAEGDLMELNGWTSPQMLHQRQCL